MRTVCLMYDCLCKINTAKQFCIVLCEIDRCVCAVIQHSSFLSLDLNAASFLTVEVFKDLLIRVLHD